MQIDQDLQAVFFRPGKRLVQLAYAAEKGRPVAKDKIGDWNADGVQADTPDCGEVPLCNVLAAMNPDAGFIDLGRQLAGR